jgi:Flagellar hook-length control protein FliK
MVASVQAIYPALPVVDARQEAYSLLAQLPAGKALQAEVLASLSDGSSVVKFADIPLRMSMNLPVAARVGDRLQLALISMQPRPTFALAPPAGAAPADPEPTVSSAGRLIGSMLQAFHQDNAPTALVGTSPLVPSPAAPAPQVAAALKDTLAFSGLFYESHLRQWVGGERPLTDLLREPQAAFGGGMPRQASPANASAGQSPPPAGRRDLPDAGKPAGSGGLARLFANAYAGVSEWTAKSRAATGLAAPESAPVGSLPPALPAQADATASARKMLDAPADAAALRHVEIGGEPARLISLQLNTLEHQHVAWHGELWPGAPMEWEISEHEADASAQAGEEGKSWQTVVRFELPALGPVAAAIRLTGGRLQMQVTAASDAAAAALRTHGAELAAALEAAGSPLELLAVKRQDQNHERPVR